MKFKLVCTAVLVVLGVQVSFGSNLLLNGGFDNANIESRTPEFNDANTGWLIDTGSADWGVVAGKATAAGTEKGMAQIVSVGASTGNELTFAFEWTPGASAGATELGMAYYVVGWKVTGSPAVADDFFFRMNSSDNEARAMIETLEGKANAVNLISGAEYTGTGAHGLGTHQSVASTGGGVTLSHTTTFTLASGDISDYDYVGVLFFNPADSEAGSTLDNVSLTVAGGAGSLPPAFTSDPVLKSNANVGDSYADSLTNDVAEVDGDTLTFSKIDGPAWLTLNPATGALSGTPTASDSGVTFSNNVFTISVSDVDGSSTSAVHIVVNAHLPPSFIAEPTVKPGTIAGKAYAGSLVGDSVEINGDTVTFAQLTGPTWLDVASNGDLTGSATTNDLGLNVFTVEVTDADGSTTGTVHISVADLQPEAGEGEMVVNWTMADPDFAQDAQFVDWENLDAGWVADKTVDVWNLTDVPGQMTMVSPTENDVVDGLAQVFSVQGSGDSLTLKFDWTAGSVASNGAENLLYEVIGWKKTGTPGNANQGFKSLQLGTTIIGDFAGNAIWTDLLDGNTGAGDTNATQGAVVGTPGVVTSVDITIDLSGFGAGNDDVSDYDVMGIRFHIGAADISGAGGVIDNVSLLAAIAPPKTIVQWGVAGGDTGIVDAGTTNGMLSTPTTYVAGTDVSEPLEAAYTNASGDSLYYIDRTDRTPGFNMAYAGTAPLTSIRGITDETIGDQISFGRNTTNFQVMVVWEAADFLVPAQELKTLAIETERTGAAATNEYRYLIQQGSQFYVSASNSLLAAHSSDGVVQVENIDWYAFAPFDAADSNGVSGVISPVATAIASFTNINSVGYYVNLVNASTGTMSSRTRYFQATATEAQPSGFDGFLAQYPVLSGDPDADYDVDGLSDWGEYVFGGIPTDSNHIGTQPSFDSGDYLFSIIGDNTLQYYVLTNLNLVSGSWGTNAGPMGVTDNSATLVGYTNEVGTATGELFIKLLVE